MLATSARRLESLPYPLPTAQRLSSADSDVIMPLPRLGIKDCLALKLIFHSFPRSPTSGWKLLEGGAAWLAEREVISGPISGLTGTLQKVPGGEKRGSCLLAFSVDSVSDLGSSLLLRTLVVSRSTEVTILVPKSELSADTGSAKRTTAQNS